MASCLRCSASIPPLPVAGGRQVPSPAAHVTSEPLPRSTFAGSCYFESRIPTLTHPNTSPLNLCPEARSPVHATRITYSQTHSHARTQTHIRNIINKHSRHKPIYINEYKYVENYVRTCLGDCTVYKLKMKVVEE